MSSPARGFALTLVSIGLIAGSTRPARAEALSVSLGDDELTDGAAAGAVDSTTSCR